MNDENLWFTVFHEIKPHTHPKAEGGAFTPDLWKHDVSELYLASPECDKYIEFNLAANGAWWSAEFSEPRVLAGRKDAPFPGVKTYHEYVPDAGWAATMVIPIAELERTLGFGDQAYGTVCSISNSPHQQCQSSALLSGDHPNFHQPQDFDKLFIRTMRE
jgi:hypothetical protein